MPERSVRCRWTCCATSTRRSAGAQPVSAALGDASDEAAIEPARPRIHHGRRAVREGRLRRNLRAERIATLTAAAVRGARRRPRCREEVVPRFLPAIRHSAILLIHARYQAIREGVIVVAVCRHGVARGTCTPGVCGDGVARGGRRRAARHREQMRARLAPPRGALSARRVGGGGTRRRVDRRARGTVDGRRSPVTCATLARTSPVCAALRARWTHRPGDGGQSAFAPGTTQTASPAESKRRPAVVSGLGRTRGGSGVVGRAPFEASPLTSRTVVRRLKPNDCSRSG